MEHDGSAFAAREAASIGARVARYRHAAGLTAQDLADRCAELGMKNLSRVSITKLENGKRGSVSTAELKVLAAALGVPPILLIFPLGHAETVEVLPGREAHPWDGIRWFTGESPNSLDGGQAARESPISLFGIHHMLVSQWRQEQAAAAAAVKAVTEAATPKARRAAEENAAGLRTLADGGWLRKIRDTMRALGYLPPDLPPDMAAALGEDEV